VQTREEGPGNRVCRRDLIRSVEVAEELRVPSVIQSEKRAGSVRVTVIGLDS
jgi:hypothetical protein